MPLVSTLPLHLRPVNFFEVRFPFAGTQEDTARYFTNAFTGNPCAPQGESRVRIREILDSNKRIYELIMHGIDDQAPAPMA
ncbi:MAG: hypothetical protein ACYDBT_00870 [Desulfobulbaceae bacterium]